MQLNNASVAARDQAHATAGHMHTQQHTGTTPVYTPGQPGHAAHNYPSPKQQQQQAQTAGQTMMRRIDFYQDKDGVTALADDIEKMMKGTKSMQDQMANITERLAKSEREKRENDVAMTAMKENIAELQKHTSFRHDIVCSGGTCAYIVIKYFLCGCGCCKLVLGVVATQLPHARACVCVCVPVCIYTGKGKGTR